MPLPAAAFEATSAGGVQLSAFNTAIVDIDNTHAVIGTGLNLVLAALGLPAISGLSTGTVATAGTIPALIKAATTPSGTAAVDFVSAKTVMTRVKQNHMKLLRAARLGMNAVGENWGKSAALGNYGDDFGLVAPGSVTAAATGASSIALAQGSAFLLAVANNVATLAAAWDATLTDVSAGTRALSVVAG